jgi:hypothetical protein
MKMYLYTLELMLKFQLTYYNDKDSLHIRLVNLLDQPKRKDYKSSEW